MLAKNNSKFEVQVAFCEPITAYHLDALKALIKKTALRKLKQMRIEPKRKRHSLEGPERTRIRWLT